jgi:hypothetical protein
MKKAIAKHPISLTFVNGRIPKKSIKNFSYAARRNEGNYHILKSTINSEYFILSLFLTENLQILILNIAKIAKERSESKDQNGVKRSLYKRIRMERGRDPMNMSVQIRLNNEINKPKIAREAPFNRSVIEHSMERRKIHKNDIQRLEAKIK